MSKKPIETIRVGNVQAAIWKNDSSEHAFYNATFERFYTNADGQRRSSASFGSTDLPLLEKVTSKAFWRMQELRRRDYEQSEAT